MFEKNQVAFITVNEFGTQPEAGEIIFSHYVDSGRAVNCGKKWTVHDCVITYGGREIYWDSHKLHATEGEAITQRRARLEDRIAI